MNVDASVSPVGAALLRTLRPSEWTKNLILFAALLFGERLLDPLAAARACGAFLAFCALSGTVYIVNDYVDRKQDRRHPTKSHRPIASGALAPQTALTAAVVLGSSALGWSFWLSVPLGLVSLSYLVLLTAYSLLLKHIVILDVLTIAVGFVLRAVAGGVAVSVPVSYWLLVCTILLALFLGLSKRRHELVLLADDAAVHRQSLGRYSPYLLDQMIEIVGDQEAAGQNWNFVGPFKKMTFASRMQHQIYWGSLRKPVEWSLKTVLAPWAYLASVLYHDTFWYPTKGRRAMREVLGSDWGRLFQAWERTTPDAHGYPVADGPGVGVRRTGLRAMATSVGILGTCLKEAPEFFDKRRRVGPSGDGD